MCSVLHGIAAFANTLTVSYATALTMQDPQIGKIITTFMMALITFFSFLSLGAVNTNEVQQ